MEKENAGLSLYDRLEHLIGRVNGPSDLGTNPKYLHGFGEDLNWFARMRTIIADTGPIVAMLNRRDQFHIGQPIV